jgi:hypothetical protein
LAAAGLLDDGRELAVGDLDGVGVALDDCAGADDELDGVAEDGEDDGGVDDGGVDEGGVDDGGVDDGGVDEGGVDGSDEDEDGGADVGGVAGPFTAGSGRVAP